MTTSYNTMTGGDGPRDLPRPLPVVLLILLALVVNGVI